jgi:hypothetical protein
MLAARESLPPKLKVTLVPGWAFSNCWPRAVKLSFREAAANTVTVPESFGEEDVEADDFALPEESDLPSEEEQALRASSAAAPTPATCRVRLVRRVRRADRVITDLLPRKL